MIAICFYFQVHQPIRIKKDYTFFNIGSDHFYHDDKTNREIMNKVAYKCYLPANQMMLDQINKFGQDFRIAYAITGVAVEQFKKYNPEVLDSFKKLADRAIFLYLTDKSFREKIHKQNNIKIK